MRFIISGANDDDDDDAAAADETFSYRCRIFSLSLSLSFQKKTIT